MRLINADDLPENIDVVLAPTAFDLEGLRKEIAVEYTKCAEALSRADTQDGVLVFGLLRNVYEQFDKMIDRYLI